MATKSIEEKAIEFANATIVKSTNFIVWNQVRLRYIEFSTEQDRIARQEERERCTKAAQDFTCKEDCYGYDSEECAEKRVKNKCIWRDILRKAMEGGSDGNM